MTINIPSMGVSPLIRSWVSQGHFSSPAPFFKPSHQKGSEQIHAKASDIRFGRPGIDG